MRRRKRKKQLYHRILLITIVLCALSRPVLAKESRKVENGGYWLDSEIFITEYTIPAVYGGKGRFIDIEGNRWEFSGKSPQANSHGKWKKGKTYILYMSDNGTEKTEDDIVMGTE